MRQVYALIQRISSCRMSVNVLVCGETGVGKECIARAVHESSPRSHRPFVRINCAALPDTLLESELFGHERGAFSGASQAKPGLLELADQGTLFLDEFGELSLEAQAKLLRALGEGEARRVGGHRNYSFDIRFVGATNRDLRKDIACGRFREDLYYRIAGVVLEVPPLRERPAEIEELARVFVEDGCREMCLDRPLQLSPPACELLLQHPWPGNVRELRNAMQRAVLLAAGGSWIEPEHLPPELREPAHERESLLEPVGRMEDLPAAGSTGDGVPTLDSWSMLMLKTMMECGGNQTETARRLNISRTTLRKHLDRLKIPRPRKRFA
jgi:transcriptional regulator with GAF, ATPase, and Fis domain